MPEEQLPEDPSGQETEPEESPVAEAEPEARGTAVSRGNWQSQRQLELFCQRLTI